MIKYPLCKMMHPLQFFQITSSPHVLCMLMSPYWAVLFHSKCIFWRFLLEAAVIIRIMACLLLPCETNAREIALSIMLPTVSTEIYTFLPKRKAGFQKKESQKLSPPSAAPSLWTNPIIVHVSISAWQLQVIPRGEKSCCLHFIHSKVKQVRDLGVCVRDCWRILKVSLSVSPFSLLQPGKYF